MLLCTSAWAETKMDELNRELTGVTGTNYTDWSGKQSVSDAVYAGNSAGGNSSIQIRGKSDSGIVTTTSGGKVKTVDITFDSHTVIGRVINIYGKNTAYESPKDLYDNSKQGNLLGTITYGTNISLYVSGDYQYIGIRPKSDAAFLSKIDITWEEVVPPAVETPVITFDPAAPYQGDNVICTITCATEGATIQYSTDGENYDDYTAAFTLPENTTTVKAMATLGEDESEVASKSIEFKPTVQTVGAFPTEANTDFKFNGEAIVTYNNGKYCYIKDNTSSALLFDNSFTNSQLGSLVGKKITGFKGITTLYNGLHEVSNINDLAYADVDPVTVTPTERTITEIMTGNLQNEFAVLRGVSITAPVNQNFTITDAEEHTLQGRDNFSLQDFPTNVTYKVFDIEGFVGIYNETIQFYPTKFTDVTPAAPFAITVNPVAGTYTEPVTVTITANDEQAMITYTLNGGNELDYTEPFTLNETTAVHVYATDGTNEATWDGTYTINIPEPVELDGMIVFADNEAGDATTNLNSDGVIERINKGGNYIKSVSDIDKVYAGATGLKFSSSKASGTMTLNLANKWNATKISFIAKNWASDNGTFDQATMTVNGNSFDLSNEFDLYEVTLTEPQQIETITFAANKRAYLKVINIEGEVVLEKTATPEIVVTEGEESYTVTATGAGEVKLYQDNVEVGNPCVVARTSEEQTFVFTATAQEEGKDISDVATQNVTVPALPATTYTITLDKQPGDYTELVNVKATVEPALPDGATLTFKINDAEPKAYNPEKGVNMLESGTLTFTATDAAGNELATTSAEYKYIMGVFGDLNNDGTVDVTEVGIIVNLILGKLNN